MNKEETIELPFPKKEYEEYAKWAKKLGYETVDAFVEKATREYLKHLKRKLEEETSEGHLKCPVCEYQLTEVMPKNPNEPVTYSCEKHGPMAEMKQMFPKRVIDFLTDVQEGVGMAPTEYVYYCVIHAIAADLDCGEVFAPTPKHYVEKYNLTDILKGCNALLPDC